MGREKTTGASPRQVEQTMRMAFYVALVVLLIYLLMFILSMGNDNETESPFLLLLVVALVSLIGFLWRRAYWRLRRAALENGYE